MWQHIYFPLVALLSLLPKHAALHYNSSCLPDSIQMGVLTEIWSGLSGGDDVNELKTLPSYPEQPDRQTQAGDLEFNDTLHSITGIRTRAYFNCFMSGHHTFSIKCDYQCRFTVKADEDFYDILGYQDVLYYPSYQDLWSLYLMEGKLYFLEVLHVQKEDGGYFAVGVTLPNGRVMRPITKEHLVMYIPDPILALQCSLQEALGMESGAISDGQISASSEYNANHGASRGRLHSQMEGIKTGAWSSAIHHANQWLQVYVGNQYTRVTAVATQGRNSSVVDQWVTKYQLHYSKDEVHFEYYKEQGQTIPKEFAGNTDRDTVVSHDLNPPITARYIRFVPVAWHSWISMRVELYGCQAMPRSFAEPGSWGEWSECKVTCGNGHQSRSRTTCTDPPTGIFHGLDSAFNLIETKGCTLSSCPECLAGWTLFMGSCYKMHSSAKWDAAVLKCLDLNSKLVDIESNDENAFVGNFVASAGFSKVWIGLSDQQQEGLFVWTNGAQADFTSWDGGEPNGDRNENCVFIRPSSMWVDSECSRTYKFICEKPVLDSNGNCNNNPIGMESGNIPDQAITFNNTSGGYGNRKGRLGLPSSTWCGNNAQSGYMQISLPHLYRICAVATQGGGPDNYFFSRYVLQLSADGITWDVYQENNLVKVFDGNVNQYTVKKNALKPKIAASTIRLYYLSEQYYHLLPCIRAEIYGFQRIEARSPFKTPTIDNVWFEKRRSLSAAWSPMLAYYTYGTLQGYLVQYHEADGSGTQHAKTQRTTGTSIQIEGLKAFTNYCISVAAFNKHGLGRYSEPGCLFTDEGVPTAPANVTTYSTSSVSFRVDWLPLPQEFASGVLTGYTVRYRQTPNTFTGDVFVGIDQPTTWEYRGLQVHTQYCVQVLGETKYGRGPENYAGCVNVTTDVGAPTQPPPNITSHNTSSTSLQITWEAVPEEFAKAPILGYALSYRKAEESSVKTRYLCPEQFQFSLHNLTIFTNYCIQLSTFTRSGNGNMSDCVFSSTDEEVPEQPPANITAYNTSSTSIRVSWDPVPEPFRQGIILGYRVYLMGTQQQDPGRRKRSTSPDEIVSDTTNLTTEFQDLEKYSNYCVQVVAYTRIGESIRTNASCVLTDEDVPSEGPTNFTGHNTSSTSLVIKWSSIPQEFINGILLGYKIYYARASELNIPYETLTLSPETFTKELTGLWKYTEYCIQIAGFTRKGDGRLTQCLNIVTDQDIPSSVLHPVTASSYESSHKITFSWQPLPQSEINGELLGYKVQYHMVAEGGELVTDSELLTEMVQPDKNFFDLNDQSVYTSFRFKVAAVTSAGEGNFSEEVTGETCRCEKEVTVALRLSSLDKDGTLSRIISEVIKETCRYCQEHGETELVIEHGDKEPDLSFPVTATTVRGSQFSKYLPVIQVPGMLVIQRNEPEVPGVYQKVVTSSIFDNWPVFVFAILTMILAGIIVWILDSRTNREDFPPSFIRGAGEGFWWSFITMTTVGYGDRCPKRVLAKAFAIVWFLIGLIIFTFFGSAVAAMMTVTVITGGPTLKQTTNKISAVTNSTDYNLAVKTLHGKWEMGKSFDTAEKLVGALKSGEVDAIFVGMYLPLKRTDLFNGTWFEVTQLVEADISHGIILRGEAMKMHKVLEAFIAHNNVQSNYLSSGDEDKVSPPVQSNEATFFEIGSPYYVVTMIVIASLLGCAIVCGLTYEILRRIKEKKQGTRGLSKRDKEALANELHEVVKSFRESFLARMTAMKRKHKRQLQQIKPGEETMSTRL